MAPLNPAFKKMVEARQRGLKTSALRTSDGHGLGLVPSPVDLSHLVGRANDQRKSLRRALPDSFDLRDYGRLTAVRDQGAYGTCWAFATYGSMESCLLSSLGETWNFSENNMANLSGFDYGFDGGGFSVMATAYLVRWTGPINDSDDPYPNPGGSTTNPPVKHVQRVDIIGRRPDSLENDEIKQAVYDHGALCVGIYWSSGAYNSSTHSFYYTNQTYANHAVDIVGWDDSYSSNNFSTVPASNGAFIVRNSWGTGWGEAGYFYVSYYDGTFARDLSEANYLFLNAENTNTYTQNYQYDPLGWVNSVGYGSSTAWMANIFAVTNNGDLKAVSFYAVSTNASYEVYIYGGVSSNQPRSGTLLSSKTGSLTNAGYYTVALTNSISLSVGDGNAFAVVVKLVTPSYNYPIPVEYAYSGYSSHATASPGQSFISSAGSTWYDTTSIDSTMNVCLKAFMTTTVYPYPAPSGCAASVDAYDDKVRLSWASVSGATQYAVYRSTSSSVLTASLLANTDAICYDDTSVTRGVIYYYWVKAIGPEGTSDFSESKYGCARMLAPTGLSATSGTSADNVGLNWNSSSGAQGYIVCRGQINSTNYAAEIARSSSVAYDDTSASPGTRYYYWIRAYSTASTSALSSSASGYRTLSAPTGVSASQGTCSLGVRVTWSGVSGAISYRIWRSTSSSSSSAVNIGETSETGYTDTTATPGVTYYYWLQAKKWSMVGGLSSSAHGWRYSMAAGNNARADFDGDGIMDFAVYQETMGMWYIRLSGSAYATISYQLGGPGFSQIACDYDGDGKTDPAVYQRDNGLWAALLSGSGNALVYAVLGGYTFDPVPGDYDGDGRADAAVFQEASGTWQVLLSKQNYAFLSTVFGGPGNTPVPADFDGDGKLDPVFYFEDGGQNLGYWYMALSGSGYAATYKTTSGSGCEPVPADYDGDNIADMAIYSSSSGLWYYWSSASNSAFPVVFSLGGSGYTAVPADYDGDAKADIAVYQESGGMWYFLLSAQNYASAYGELGGPGFQPVAAR